MSTSNYGQLSLTLLKNLNLTTLKYHEDVPGYSFVNLIKNKALPSNFFPQFIFLISLSFTQCLLLHPIFINSRAARLTRKTIMPLSSIGWTMLPFKVAKKPLEVHECFNFYFSLYSIYMAVKCAEWGLLNKPCYRTRLRRIDGVLKWMKEELSEDEKRAQEKEYLSTGELCGWTLTHMLSSRGFGFDWGMPGVANTRSLSSLIESFEGNQMNILRASGLPDFLGRDFLANRFLNIAFGLRSACDMDRIYTSIILFITIFNKLYLFFGASEPMHELLNPLYYPIMYDSPHFSNSLANFWSKTWHQALRRSFIFGGGKPSMWISKKLGFSRKIQKIFFLFGVYFISGLQHEYLAAAVCQKPHSNAYPSKLSPGSFIYFALQPVGIMIEPFIIPHIPKRIGGGMLWTFLFKSMVLTPFSRQFLYFQRHLQPISQIPLKSLINPFA